MDKKMLFIYNPHAGKAAIRSNLLDIIDILQSRIRGDSISDPAKR